MTNRRQVITWANHDFLLILNMTLADKLKWNLDQTAYIYYQVNTFENVVCKMWAILLRPHCGNGWAGISSADNPQPVTVWPKHQSGID